MIQYDPGYWGVACIWQLKGSVFPKALVWALPCTVLAGVLHRVLQDNDDVSKDFGVSDAAATVFNGFNFVLGFLIVFRSQQAYARWWEGGTLLQQLRGEWFNSFSCLVAFSNAAEEKQADVYRFQQQLVRLFSLLYGCALTQVSCMQVNSFELLNLDGFDPESLRFLQGAHDKCEITLQWIQRMIVEGEQRQTLKIAPPILSRVYNELGNGIVNLNNARKIKEFPIPFPLAQANMVMLLFHALLNPLICAATVKTTLWACVITFSVAFCYWSVLYIALELEMPFGDDENDLPMRDMQIDMNRSLMELLDPRASSVPVFNIDYDAGSGKQKGDLRCWSLDFDSDLSVNAVTTSELCFAATAASGPAKGGRVGSKSKSQPLPPPGADAAGIRSTGQEPSQATVASPPRPPEGAAPPPPVPSSPPVPDEERGRVQVKVHPEAQFSAPPPDEWVHDPPTMPPFLRDPTLDTPWRPEMRGLEPETTLTKSTESRGTNSTRVTEPAGCSVSTPTSHNLRKMWSSESPSFATSRRDEIATREEARQVLSFNLP